MRVAVLISGEARSVNYLGNTVLDRIIKKYNADVYLGLWNNITAIKLAGLIPDSKLNLHNPTYRPAEVVKSLLPKDSLGFKHLNLDLVSNNKKFVLSAANTMRLFYLMYQTWMRMEESGKEYDYVLRVRPDSKVRGEFVINEIKEDQVVISREAADITGIDQFFMARYKTARNIFNIWNSLPSLFKQVDLISPTGLLFKQIDNIGASITVSDYKVCKMFSSPLAVVDARPYDLTQLREMALPVSQDIFRKMVLDLRGLTPIDDIYNMSYGVFAENPDKYDGSSWRSHLDLMILGLNHMSYEELSSYIKAKKWIENGFKAYHNFFPIILEHKRLGYI